MFEINSRKKYNYWNMYLKLSLLQMANTTTNEALTKYWFVTAVPGGDDRSVPGVWHRHSSHTATPARHNMWEKEG